MNVSKLRKNKSARLMCSLKKISAQLETEVGRSEKLLELLKIVGSVELVENKENGQFDSIKL